MFIGSELHDWSLAKRLLWLLLGAMAGLIAYLTMRAYLSPELLLFFANGFTC